MDQLPVPVSPYFNHSVRGSVYQKFLHLDHNARLDPEKVGQMKYQQLSLLVEELGYDLNTMGDGLEVLRNFVLSLIQESTVFKPHQVAQEVNLLCGKYRSELKELKAICVELATLERNPEVQGFGLQDLAAEIPNIQTIGEELRVMVVGENSSGKVRAR